MSAWGPSFPEPVAVSGEDKGLGGVYPGGDSTSSLEKRKQHWRQGLAGQSWPGKDSCVTIYALCCAAQL